MANVPREAQPRSDWITFTLFKWTWRSHATSFPYLKHCTPCDWLTAWSGQYWKFLNQFFCVLWSLQQFLQSPEGEARTRRRKSQNSNLPGGVGEKKACWATAPQRRTLLHGAVWVTPCCCYSLPFKVEDAMACYLLGKTTKSCLRVARMAARHRATFYTFLTDGCTSLLRPWRHKIQRDGLHVSSTRDNDWHTHTAANKATYMYCTCASTRQEGR